MVNKSMHTHWEETNLHILCENNVVLRVVSKAVYAWMLWSVCVFRICVIDFYPDCRCCMQSAECSRACLIEVTLCSQSLNVFQLTHICCVFRVTDLGSVQINSLRLLWGCATWDQSRNVRFEVFTAVTMKNGVFWDVTPCGSCKNRRFGGT
jgi:hypothetical protein